MAVVFGRTVSIWGMDMAYVFTFLVLGAFVYGAWQLLRVVFSKKRKQAAFRLLASVVVLIAGNIGLAVSLDPATRYGGFETADERRLARDAGVSDPEHWAENRETILAELERAQAAEAAEREAAAALVARQREEEAAERARQREAEAAERARLAAIEAEQCRQTLTCWGEKVSLRAEIECKRNIERLANWDHEWDDGFLNPTFTRYRWADRDLGTVSIIGDKIKFQNGFGAWQNHIYECVVLPETDLVFEVSARPGRL